MGLMACKTLTELSGGTIFAQSAGKNQGSIFCITMKTPQVQDPNPIEKKDNSDNKGLLPQV